MGAPAPLRWKHVYHEAELYKSAVRVYTKPLFQWRKALSASADGETLYDLAARGLRGLDAIHRALQREAFTFRPAVGLRYNFNGKHRTLYIPPWQERIVDLLLYRIFTRRLHQWFSPNSYAYRDNTYGLDGCQSRIARLLRSSRQPFYLVKRDIADYFASVDHDVLLCQLKRLMEPDDYLFRLAQQRIQFAYRDEAGSHEATIGLPFGCATACAFANIYLTGLDHAIERIPDVHYFRYADDILLLSHDRGAASEAVEVFSRGLRDLKLRFKESHEANFLLTAEQGDDRYYRTVAGFRHLGLLFRTGGSVALSRDKRRKIQNLFRFAFRRRQRAWKRFTDPCERARTLAAIASDTVEKGVRNVAIIDYYLKHVTDTAQLQQLDRWLAEEVLSLVFGGHKKGHFARISFKKLRECGLPSLVHRQRRIVHGHTRSPFFIWQRRKADRALRGTVARLARAGDVRGGLLSVPRSSSQQKPVGEGGCL